MISTGKDVPGTTKCAVLDEEQVFSDEMKLGRALRTDDLGFEEKSKVDEEALTVDLLHFLADFLGFLDVPIDGDETVVFEGLEPPALFLQMMIVVGTLGFEDLLVNRGLHLGSDVGDLLGDFAVDVFLQKLLLLRVVERGILQLEIHDCELFRVQLNESLVRLRVFDLHSDRGETSDALGVQIDFQGHCLIYDFIMWLLH